MSVPCSGVFGVLTVDAQTQKGFRAKDRWRTNNQNVVDLPQPIGRRICLPSQRRAHSSERVDVFRRGRGWKLRGRPGEGSSQRLMFVHPSSPRPLFTKRGMRHLISHISAENKEQMYLPNRDFAFPNTESMKLITASHK
jgi:hypothetical protein